MYVRIYIHIKICMYVCMYVCMCVCIYIHIYVYIYIYMRTSKTVVLPDRNGHSYLPHNAGKAAEQQFLWGKKIRIIQLWHRVWTQQQNNRVYAIANANYNFYFFLLNFIFIHTYFFLHTECGSSSRTGHHPAPTPPTRRNLFRHRLVRRT